MQLNVNAIIFDLGGVILNLDYNLTINAFKKLGQENFEQLYTQSQQDKLFDRFETGEVNAEEFRRYMKSFLPADTNSKTIDEAWNVMLLDLPKHRINLLLELKKQVPIFLFSNTNEIHLNAFRKIIFNQYGKEDLLESVFNKTYYSHIVGHRKPNAEAFYTVINDHHLTPQKTLFIDDSIQHIEGAKKIGLQTIHLTSGDISDLF